MMMTQTLGRLVQFRAKPPARRGLSFAEYGNFYRVTADLPGLDMTEVEVAFVLEHLTISGMKAAAAGRSQRSARPVMYNVALPEDADPKTITAWFKDGRLIVTIARRRAIKP